MKREHRLGAIQMRVSAMERRGSQVKEEVEEKEQGGQSWGWGGEWGGGRACKCHKNQEEAARPLRRITAAVKWMWKQGKALRNIDLTLQPEKGEMCASDYVRSISHPYKTWSSSVSTLQKTTARHRKDALLCGVTLCEVQLWKESLWKAKEAHIRQKYANCINFKENIKEAGLIVTAIHRLRSTFLMNSVSLE